MVVVVTILDGSFGSGIRFDCENLSEPRFVIASSVVKVCSTRVNRTRCGVSGKLTMSVEKRSLKSCIYMGKHSSGLGVGSCLMLSKRESLDLLFGSDDAIEIVMIEEAGRKSS